ncbi:hypothetical protein [Streptomyces sp. NPDC088180]|uniref:hypothetical protein n=1 Tax=Streptomyces sp. NPDC088180 TaxID=3365837 RepID=UPI00381E9DA6
MDEKTTLQELIECIAQYNKASRAAGELWAQAERESHRIGQLAAILLTRGTSAAEVGRLLVAVDDTCTAPPGLLSSGPLDGERLDEEKSVADSACESNVGVKAAVRVPAQNEPTERQSLMREPCDRTRALDIVRDMRWPSGITVGTVVRALAADGRVITEALVRGWMKEWTDSGDVVSAGPGRYIHSSRTPHSPTLGTSEHAPLLLRRAYQVVSGTPLKELSTRNLAIALDENVNVIGGELCAMLREVGVTRPNRGKISERYEGKTGQRLPGYKAETLGRAIALYNEREARYSQTVSTSRSVPPPDQQLDSMPTDADRARVLELVSETGIIGIDQAQIVQQLKREARHAAEAHVHDWLHSWLASGILRRLRDGSYMQVSSPSAHAEDRASVVPDLLARAYEVVRAQDHEVIASRSLFAVLQQQGAAFRDSSDMASQLVRLLKQVNVNRPENGYIRPHPGQPRVLGFTASTLRRAVKAYQKKLVLA